MSFSKGQFGYDLRFLADHFHPITLSRNNGSQQAIVVPALQGRIMTSTADGLEGKSFGWINHDLIASKKILKNINPFGGEDRFWMGPEAGQFGLFFKHGNDFTFENSQVPAIIDTDAFELIHHDSESIELKKTASLINYSNAEFSIQIGRRIRLLNEEQISNTLGIELNGAINVIGMESANTINNLGHDWKKDAGLLSIWMIGVFNATDRTTVIIPVQNAERGINAEYFGTLNESRLKIKDNNVYFRGDGSFRSKIGITPQNARSIFGSYDFENDVLTIVQFSFRGDDSYVNSMWEMQAEPYKGDVINSYNDGPLTSSSDQLGKFYELETSSPAKELKSGESIEHLHRTFHFQGRKEVLTTIAQKLLHVDISSDPLQFD